MTKKLAYLTIDDGPSGDFQQKLDYLISKNIPAILFCTGRNIEILPELIINAIKFDYIIGNHAYSHISFSNLSLEQCFEEIARTDKIIDKLYQKIGITRIRKYFRFPYGDKGGFKYSNICQGYEREGKVRKERIQEFLRSQGFTRPEFCNQFFRNYDMLEDVDWCWTFDIAEYAVFEERHFYDIDSLEKVLVRIDEYFLSNFESEDIILLHDHKKSTKFFRTIIDKLLSKNIEFKRPDWQ